DLADRDPDLLRREGLLGLPQGRLGGLRRVGHPRRLRRVAASRAERARGLVRTGGGEQSASRQYSGQHDGQAPAQRATYHAGGVCPIPTTSSEQRQNSTVANSPTCRNPTLR